MSRLRLFHTLALVAVAVACRPDAGEAEPTNERAHPNVEKEHAEAEPAPEVRKDLPDAAGLLAKHVEAAGGVASISKIESAYFEGRIETGKQGMDATAKLWWKPGRFYLEETITGSGTSSAGYDGETAWTDDPVSGLRKLEGEEAEAYIRSSTLFLCHDWQKFFTSATTIGEVEVEGRPAWQVELRSPLGQAVMMGFDKETHLLSEFRFEQIGPTGKMPVVAYPSDYRPLGGYLIAHAQRSLVPPLFEFSQTYDKVEINLPIADERFAMPGSEGAVPADPKDG